MYPLWIPDLSQDLRKPIREVLEFGVVPLHSGEACPKVAGQGSEPKPGATGWFNLKQ